VHLDAPGDGADARVAKFDELPVQRINVKNFVLLDRQFAGHI
jgi:hypothetical protein